MRDLIQQFLIMLALSGLIVTIATEGALHAAPAETLAEKTRPYETHEEMLLVQFTVHTAAPPTIEGVEKLERGRVTMPIPGVNRLKLIGRDGRVLYSRDFTAEFILLSDPPVASQAARFSYVVPYSPEVARVVVSTPRGEAELMLAPDF